MAWKCYSERSKILEVEAGTCRSDVVLFLWGERKDENVWPWSKTCRMMESRESESTYCPNWCQLGKSRKAREGTEEALDLETTCDPRAVGGGVMRKINWFWFVCNETRRRTRV